MKKSLYFTDWKEAVEFCQADHEEPLRYAENSRNHCMVCSIEVGPKQLFHVEDIRRIRGCLVVHVVYVEGINRFQLMDLEQ